MDIIYRGRAEGKTTELIKRSIEENAYIIVINRGRALAVKKLADKLGYRQLLFPVTFQEYMSNKMRGSYVRNVLIDDADDLIKLIFSSVNVLAITMSKRDNEEV